MSDIRIKMAKDLRDMSDMVGDLHWMAAKAVEALIKKESEIAKRDARIVELESAAESLIISRDYHHEQEIEYRRRWAGLYAAPVSEAKAQGVVMQATDGGRNPRYEGLFDGETEEHRASRLAAHSAKGVV